MNTLKRISFSYRDLKEFLDVGCGDGTRTLCFDDYQRKINGVDRLNWLQEQSVARVDFIQHDFIEQPLPFPDASFDLILSFDVIEHLPQPRIMLREIHRVLKDGGIFVISTPNRDRLFGFFLCRLGIRKFPYAPDPGTVQTDPYACHVMEYTSGDLKKLLQDEGFDVVRQHSIYYGITGSRGIRSLCQLPFYHNIILECGKHPAIGSL